MTWQPHDVHVIVLIFHVDKVDQQQKSINKVGLKFISQRTESPINSYAPKWGRKMMKIDRCILLAVAIIQTAKALAPQQTLPPKATQLMSF